MMEFLHRSTVRFQAGFLAAVLGLFTVGSVLAADEKAVAQFYSGKTIKLIVGFGAGGIGYDFVGRLAARHLGPLIPGQPNIIVENKPGAGTMLAANYVFNAAPKDGTVMALTHQGLILRQAIQSKGVGYDARKMQWLGATKSDVVVCIVRSDLGIKSIKDAMNVNGKEVIIGASGPGAGDHDRPVVIASVLGAKLKLIAGYESNAKIQLAMLGGEVDGQCTTWNYLQGSKPEWFKEPKPFVRTILTLGERPDLAVLKDVPAAEDLATPQGKKILTAFAAMEAAQMPFWYPPGVPPERVAAVSEAFRKVWEVPALRDTAKKVRLALAPKSSQAVKTLVEQVLDTPPELLAQLKQILVKN